MEIKAGQRFGEKGCGFEVREDLGVRPSPTGRRRFYACLCDCGQKFEARHDLLRRGVTRSCGCHRSRRVSVTARPEYSMWENMKRRCADPRNVVWAWYGGRGIKV